MIDRRRTILLGQTLGIALMAAVAWRLWLGPSIDLSRVYRIGYGRDAPFHFKGSDGHPSGLAVDLVSRAAERRNIRLEWVEGEGFDETGVDLWVLMTVRPERLKRFHFTDSYLQTHNCFVVKSGSSIHEVKDLKGARISFLNFEVHRRNLEGLVPTMRPDPVNSSREAVDEVVHGSADAVYLDEYAVLPTLLAGDGLPPLRLVPTYSKSSKMALASTFATAAVADAIRDEMRLMLEDGSLDAIAEHWGIFPNLTTELIQGTAASQRRLKWLKVGVAGLSLLLLFSIRMTRKARRQTHQLERARSESEAAEKRYQNLFENMHSGFMLFECIVDEAGKPIDHRLIDANAEFDVQTGLSRSKEIGRTSAELTLKLPPEVAQRYYEVAIHRKPLHWERFNESLRRYYDVRAFSPGERQFALIINDITGRKELEIKLLQSQKLESVGQLAGGVAHDFNNMLAAISMEVDLLLLNGDVRSEVRETLENVAKEVLRAGKLTRQLLMFSRRSVLEIKTLDINSLVAEFLKMLGRLIGEQISIRFTAQAGLPTVRADAGMLEQVLMNLSVNARDAMPNGGELRINLESLQIDKLPPGVDVEFSPGIFVCLSVTDTGCGMDEAVCGRIFEPFFTTKEPGKGTGLGLATVHGIIAQHNGWIAVLSAAGRGTTFRVFLPGVPHQAVERESIDKPKATLGSATILLVEDEPVVRHATVRALTQLGYTVVAAVDALEGLKTWNDHRGQFDLLMTDMVMPGGMTGLELAVKIQETSPGIPVIVATGYSNEASFRGLPANAKIVRLQKPYQLGELATLIKRCLQKE